jgi:hypothetical protein
VWQARLVFLFWHVLQVRQGLLVGFAVLLPLIGLVCLPAVFIMHMTPVRSAHSVRTCLCQ